MAYPEMTPEPNDKLLVRLLGVKLMVVYYGDVAWYLDQLEGERRPSRVTVAVDRVLSPLETDAVMTWAAAKTGCGTLKVTVIEEV